MKVRAKVVKKIFSKESFYIWALVPVGDTKIAVSHSGTFSLKGDLGYLVLNKEYDLDIEFVEMNKFGVTYKLLETPQVDLDLDDDKEHALLCEITTPSQAEHVNKAYPSFIRMVLEGKEKEIDVNNIYNVKEKRKEFLIREIKHKLKFFAIKIQFPEYEFSVEDCKKLDEEYGSLDTIKQELDDKPYHNLIYVLQRGFESSDDTILSINPLLKESFQRTEHLIIEILNRNQYDGNTRMSAREMAYYAKQIAPECLSNMKQVAEESLIIFYDEDTNMISRMDTFVSEMEFADFVKDKVKNSTKLDINWTKYTTVDGFKLTEQQRVLLKNFCEYSFSMLVGYSGSGKSSSVSALIDLLEDNNLTYTLLAPTGKASQRLNEVTNRPTSTLHRALACDRMITTDVLIFDEFSFIGTEWASMLINGIDNTNIRIVLVGDNAQLNPISHGKVFDDLIESGSVPFTLLKQIFRYAEGGTLACATDIRNGKCFLTNESEQQFGDNYFFKQSDNPLIDVTETYMGLINKGIKPHEIMCLSPFNISELGTININSILQDSINPPKPNQIEHSIKVRGFDVRFRLGDYVINTKNNYKALTMEAWETLQYDSDLDADDVEKASIYNGDTGYIRSIDEKKLVVQFGEELIVYGKHELKNLLLAYSISTHKSQGSECPYVINITNSMHSSLLTRNLIYVASTRNSKEHYEIGNVSTFKEALEIEEAKDRDTWLKELLNS